MPDNNSNKNANGTLASAILGLSEGLAPSDLARLQNSVLQKAAPQNVTAGDATALTPQPINIAMLTHNALEYTQLCLRSLQENTPYPFNIFILDNASTDDTPAWLQAQKLSNLHFKLSKVNRGVPGGRNDLIEMMRPFLGESSFAVFLDNDMEVRQGWADAYLNFFAEHPEAAIVSAHGHRFLIRGEQRFLMPAPTRPEAVDVACGGFACWIRSEALFEVGKFDENLGLFWHEDDDLSVRAIGLGWEVYSLPGVPVVHHEHKSGAATPGIQRDGSPENQRYLINKWQKMGFVDANGCIKRNSRKRASVTRVRELLNTVLPPPVVSTSPSEGPIPVIVRSTPTISVSQTPHIGIDARTFIYPETAQRGIGHYTFNHLQALIRQTPDWQYTLYLERLIGQESLDRLLRMPNVKWASFNAPMPGHDLFHIPDPMTILTGYDSPVRLAPKVPTTAVFYDLIPLICRGEHFDQWFPPLQATYMSRLEQLKLSNCHILSISENTSSDLQRATGIPASRITTIMAGLNRAPSGATPCDADIQRVRAKFGIQGPFILTVGGIDSHKNFMAVANAFIMASPVQKFNLVVVGSEIDPYKQRFKDQFEKNGIGGVIFTGYLSREELECLYASASALAFPSKYEGFGFPVLEAMAYGCPVITTNAASLPEVAGDAAIMVSPDDYEGMARAMLTVISDPATRSTLRERGLRRAQLFSWDKAAAKTLEVWSRIAGIRAKGVSPDEAPGRIVQSSREDALRFIPQAQRH